MVVPKVKLHLLFSQKPSFPFLMIFSVILKKKEKQVLPAMTTQYKNCTLDQSSVTVMTHQNFCFVKWRSITETSTNSGGISSKSLLLYSTLLENLNGCDFMQSYCKLQTASKAFITDDGGKSTNKFQKKKNQGRNLLHGYAEQITPWKPKRTCLMDTDKTSANVTLTLILL